MPEVLIDQTTKLGQTVWNGAAAWQGQLWTPDAGEIWRVTEISGYGDANTWKAKEGYCGLGICNSFTDWDPNNGLLLGGECTFANLVSSGGKHTFDMTSISGFSNGILCASDHLYFFYFRLAASSAGAQCHSSSGYAPHANAVAIDSSDSGGTWSKPASWISGSDDLRFEMVGTKVEASSGAGTQVAAGNYWSF